MACTDPVHVLRSWWAAKGTPVNKVIGDASFMELIGHAPGLRDSEDVRIHVHLQHITAKLKSASRHDLSSAQAMQRTLLLEALATYAQQRCFPKNTDRLEARTPVFIDHERRPCAVAHLMQVSGHGHLATAVDAHFHLAEVAEVKAAAECEEACASDQEAWHAATRLMDWATSHGLEEEELAAIQPGYTPHDMAMITMAAVCLSVQLVLGLLVAIGLTVIGYWSMVELMGHSSGLGLASRFLMSGVLTPVALVCLAVALCASPVQQSQRWCLRWCLYAFSAFMLVGVFVLVAIGFIWADKSGVLPYWVRMMGMATLSIPAIAEACVALAYVVWKGLVQPRYSYLRVEDGRRVDDSPIMDDW